MLLENQDWVDAVGGANTSRKTSCSEDHGKGYGQTPAATVQRVNSA
jgi:hypothetical protein